MTCFNAYQRHVHQRLAMAGGVIEGLAAQYAHCVGALRT